MDFPLLELQEMKVLDHVLAFVICVVAPFVAFSSQRILMEDLSFDTKEKIHLYHSNAMFLLITGLAVITVWRVTDKTMGALGFDWPIWHDSILWLFGLIAFFYFLDVFFQFGLKKWRIKSLSKSNQAIAFIPSSGKEFIHFTTLALAAGIGEEIIFRGFLIQYIVFWVGNDITGFIFGAIFSSAIFAFLHGYQGYKSIIKIFFLSLLLAAIFIISHSLIYVMIIHAVIDIVSGGLNAYFLSTEVKANLKDDVHNHQ